MLIYDINSFPDDLDISVWYNLFEKGLAVYDSKKGMPPFISEDTGLALIDIREMTSTDILKVSDKIVEINKELALKNEKEMTVIRENNLKLINYLKFINENIN